MEMQEFVLMFSVAMAIGFGLCAMAGWIGYTVRGLLQMVDTHQ